MEKLKNSTILYIEDDEITRENISSFLQRKCKNFFIACDGKEGLELFEKYTPDIIITDIEMPNLDGLSMDKKNPKTINFYTNYYYNCIRKSRIFNRSSKLTSNQIYSKTNITSKIK